MKPTINKTVILAAIALSLALFACADQSRQQTERTTSPAPAGSGSAGAGQEARPSQAASPAALARLTEDERNTIGVVDSTKNSVVFVTNIQLVRDFFYATQEVPRGSGSGFVWDDQGHIVTNNHVVEDGARFIVTLPNQEEVEARLVGKEPNKDVAVLQLEKKAGGLSPVTVGASEGLMVGQKVIAIGNPFGFDHTVTTGIVSALGRDIPGAGGVTIRDMIQTDASINPGNSGGPLLNSAGELIGMNTMIIDPSGAGMSAGVGFAIPVDTIKKIVPQIIQYGKVIRPGLGVSFVADEYVRRAGVRLSGAVVANAPDTSEAYRKGIRGLARDRYGYRVIQDIIVAIDDKKVESYSDLYNVLDGYKIGDAVTLTVERDGKTRKVQITLVSID